jgi:hypothetical protein
MYLNLQEYFRARIFLFFLIAILISCSSSNKLSKIEIEKITFGYGGGFTGAITSYSLAANGDLRKLEWQTDTLIKKIDPAVMQQLFEKSKPLISYQFNEPGNMYSFMEIETKKGNQKIMWSLNSHRVDERVTQLYKELIALTK